MPTWSAVAILAVSIGVMSWVSVRLTPGIEGFGARLPNVIAAVQLAR